jgi:hypothetical protein
MPVTRLYLQNQAADYTPPTIRGAWDDLSSSAASRLGRVPSGASASDAIAEVSIDTAYDVLLRRFVSDPLASDVAFSTSDVVSWCIGILESSGSLNAISHLHVFVTQGDSDNVRGTLLSDYAGGVEWPTAARGRLYANVPVVNDVGALTGDRLVVEVGYRANNSSTISYTGTLYRGGTGSPDLTDASPNVTTEPGWIEFPGHLFGPQDDRIVAQSGLMVEATSDERRIALSGLVVEVSTEEPPTPPSDKTQPTRAPFWGRF